MKEAVRSVECEVWSVKFEVWSAKSAVCGVRCGVSREGHGRDRMSLNYRSFMFGKLPPPACPGLCYIEEWSFHHSQGLWPISCWDDHTPCIPCIVIYKLRYMSAL